MSSSQNEFVWLKDLLEHLSTCRQQLEWTEDPETRHRLTETMLQDIDRCRRICESWRQQTHRALQRAG